MNQNGPRSSAKLLKTRDRVRANVAKFEYFQEWNEETITELCRISKIRTFGVDEIILGGKCDLRSYVYFVTEGCCRVIRSVGVSHKTKHGTRTRTYFVNVCILNRLSCFNIGEDLKDCQIVATVDTECLLIPFYWLLERNEANIWIRIKQFLDWKIPKTLTIIQDLKKEEKWRQRKQKMIRTKMKRNVDTLGFHDVPYSLKVLF